jgi:hypothetical protein
MILIDSKHFTSLNSGIISMRKNVGAIRKTLLKNRTLNLRLQTKQKLYDQQLKESEERRQQESKREQSRRGGGINLSLGNFLKKPGDIFKAGGGLSDVLQRVVLFFSFALVGWMLKALPSIIKSVQAFMKSAKSFIQSLSEFWGSITGFFTFLWNGIEGLYKKLGLGGTDGLDETSEKKTRDMLADIATELGKFLLKLPGLVFSLVKSLIQQHERAKDIKRKNPNLTNQEAADAARNELLNKNQQPGQPSPTRPIPGSPLPLQKLIPGTRGFIQGGSGRGSETGYGAHFHLSPPSTDAAGLEKAREVAFQAIKLMLQRGSRVWLSNYEKFVPPNASDSVIKDMIKREQDAHTKPNRTRGGIDIQEGEPGKEAVIPGYLGTKSVFPLATGTVTGSIQGGYGREAEVIGSGGVVLAHGSAGSTASGQGAELTTRIDPERYGEVVRSPGPRVVEINETVIVPLPPSISKERQQRYNAVFSGDRKIEVISIDGESASSNPLFEN